jgi:uncharacterized protein (DUF427 family)
VTQRADGISDPYFYIPRKDLLNGVLEKIDPNTKKGYWLARLSAGGKNTERVLSFDPSGPLEYLVRIEVSALGKMAALSILEVLITVDAWFVEDEKLLGPHPKDPYKRVETIPSSREIRIEVDGTVVATSTQNIFLYETMLRTRYYLSSTTINYEYLTESETTTYCPYKGMAKYVLSQLFFLFPLGAHFVLR